MLGGRGGLGPLGLFGQPVHYHSSSASRQNTVHTEPRPLRAPIPVDSKKQRKKDILYFAIPGTFFVLIVIALGLTVKFGYIDHLGEDVCTIDSRWNETQTCQRKQGKYYYSYDCLAYCISFTLSLGEETHFSKGCSYYDNWNDYNQTTVKCYYDYKDPDGKFVLSLLPVPLLGVFAIIPLSIVGFVMGIFTLMGSCFFCKCGDKIKPVVDTKEESMTEITHTDDIESKPRSETSISIPSCSST